MATAIANLFDTAVIDEVELLGLAVGSIEFRYGLLSCDETISIEQVLNRAGDLAVADRLAFVYATRSHAQVAVLEMDGWYYVAALDRAITTAQVNDMRSLPGSPRVHSLVTQRGISPVVGPLVR